MKSALLDSPITLVGMPGAGKTTVGRLLAARLNRLFFDSDEAVVRGTGRSVSTIFRVEGEAGFRARERTVIARQLDLGPAIVATGGGAMIDPLTRALLLSRTITVWLDASTDRLVPRLKQASSRPMLRGTDLAVKVAAMAADRGPLYAQAHLRVAADDDADAVLARLLAALVG